MPGRPRPRPRCAPGAGGGLRGVHGGLPELLGVHLAEALVALDGEALLGAVEERLDRLVERPVALERSPFDERGVSSKLAAGQGGEARLGVRQRAVLGASRPGRCRCAPRRSTPSRRAGERDAAGAVLLVAARTSTSWKPEASRICATALERRRVGERLLVAQAVEQRDARARPPGSRATSSAARRGSCAEGCSTFSSEARRAARRVRLPSRRRRAAVAVAVRIRPASRSQLRP